MNAKKTFLWVPAGHARIKVPYSGPVPKRLWTLFMYFDENQLPSDSIYPRHNVNAFLEDRIHDWDVRNGALHYYSRISQGGNWLLLEF